MPRENKKRGRRAEEKKRKLEAAGLDEPDHKRQKQQEALATADYIPLDLGPMDSTVDEDAAEMHAEVEADGEPEAEPIDGAPHPGEQPFYGMLDESEQEYFKSADETLDLNMFNDPEERELFLTNLYREAEGKELKLANSQSCSRLMERLIQLSTPDQLKRLFTKYSGNFVHLLQHRFASHCCEALFIKAAPVVTSEMQNPIGKSKTNGEEGESADLQDMETYFMNTLNELEEYLGYFMTHKWGSHALRVLLLVLAGEPVTQAKRKGPLQSKRKEKVQVSGTRAVEEMLLEKREVPETFATALDIMIQKCVQGLNTDFLRALAQHPTGNPTMQLLLQMELTKFGKQRAKDESSLMHKLLPDDPITEESGSASFINGLIYDPVGSRLLETIIEYAPAKTFKTIYQEFFKPRLAVLARNDVASYVIIKVLSRLSGEDLGKACEELLPHMEMLVERNRIALIRALVERSTVRGISTEHLAKSIALAYHGDNGFDLSKVLKITNPTSNSQVAVEKGHKTAIKNQTEKNVTPANERLHGSLLAQAMIAAQGPLNDLIYTSFAHLSPSVMLGMAEDPSASHTVSAALSNPQASTIHRRKLIQQYYGNIAKMAQDQYASRVIDNMWNGTAGLAFIRERVAEELAEAEHDLRESIPGRKVWRNWDMDLYKRRRRDWISKSRESAGREAFVGFPDEQAPSSQERKAREKVIKANGEQGQDHTSSKHDRRSKGKERKSDAGPSTVAEPSVRHLTALDRARQKHAAEKARKEREAAKRDKDKGPQSVAVS